jgi:rubrerythrin
MTELVMALFIATALAVYVVSPLLATSVPGDSTLPVDVTPSADLKRRRMVIYENLQDLDFEYKAGKVSEADYQTMRRNYLSEAAQLMLASQDREQMSDHEAFIEQEVALRRAQLKAPISQAYVCPKCGFENPLPVKFCGECGAKVGGKH